MPNKISAEELAIRAHDRGNLSLGDLLFPRTSAQINPTRKDVIWNATKDIASIPGRALYGLASAAVAPFDNQSAKEALVAGLARPTSRQEELSDIIEDVVKDPMNILSEGALTVTKAIKGNALAKGLARAATLAGSDVGAQALDGRDVNWKSPLISAGSDIVGTALRRPVAKVYESKKYPEGGADIDAVLRRNPPGTEAGDNLIKFIKGSDMIDFDGKPIIVYHGSRADISEPKASTDGAFGPGFYSTDRPRIADSYSQHKKASGEPQVYPMISNAKDLFDFDSPADWDRIFMGFKSPEEQDKLRFLKSFRPRMTNGDVWHAIQQMHDEANDAIFPFGTPVDISQLMSKSVRDMGHDGIRYPSIESSQGHNYVTFDPSSLKSIYNDGAWGTRNPDALLGFTESTKNPSVGAGIARRALGKAEAKYLDSLQNK